MSICFRDIFKPRYAVIVGIHHQPRLFGGVLGSVPVPVVQRLAYKRPLSMSYRDFQNKIDKFFQEKSLVFYGTKRTMQGIEGIGSLLPHNLKNAVVVQEWMFPGDKND